MLPSLSPGTTATAAASTYTTDTNATNTTTTIMPLNPTFTPALVVTLAHRYLVLLVLVSHYDEAGIMVSPCPTMPELASGSTGQSLFDNMWGRAIYNFPIYELRAMDISSETELINMVSKV